ncbi:MAG: lipoyl synthase [Phycisphaerales bacterium]|nr:lipoyl synthase [Phycisphaerales bacterium]|tara:strand:+ start:12853 stop:13812 length:960 start_codon:yes stop_codon:yes gene_type:complete
MVLNNASETPYQMAVGRKPAWIRAQAPGGEAFRKTKELIDAHGLHTVCQEASCPNIGECWSRGTATIMILGDTCTRSCGFCNVKTGRPPQVDTDEPRRVAELLSRVDLNHVVITSVDRDDLSDGGAAIWAETIERVHESCPDLSVEALVGDFKGSKQDLDVVIRSRPEILSHNMETVKRMHPAVRPQADYDRSLQVLRRISDAGLVSKTSIMVGIGERDDEIETVLSDIRQIADADIVTIGQYLQPTRNHLPIDRWVHPDQFETYREQGLDMGFKVVESGPLVRSSYHAEEQARKLSPADEHTAGTMKSLLSKARDNRL